MREKNERQHFATLILARYYQQAHTFCGYFELMPSIKIGAYTVKQIVWNLSFFPHRPCVLPET